MTGLRIPVVIALLSLAACGVEEDIASATTDPTTGEALDQDAPAVDTDFPVFPNGDTDPSDPGDTDDTDAPDTDASDTDDTDA